MHPRRRDRTVPCSCQSHCTPVVAHSHKMLEAESFVSRSTRSRHREDDRLLHRSHCHSTHTITKDVVVAEPLQGLNLVEAEVDTLGQVLSSIPVKTVVFRRDPRTSEPFTIPTGRALYKYNQGDLSLLDSARSNHQILEIEARLCMLAANCLSSPSSPQRKSVRSKIADLLRSIIRQKGAQWLEQRGIIDGQPAFVNTEAHFARYGPTDSLTRVAGLLSVALGNMFMQPQRGLRAHLAGLSDLLKVQGNLDAPLAKDPRTYVSAFRLDPVTRTYVVCPACHALHLYCQDAVPASLRCSQRQTPQSAVCGAEIYTASMAKNGSTNYRPVRKYVHHDLKAWVGRLLSRKGIEDLIEARPTVPEGEDVSDIWSASVFRSLKGPDRLPFYPGPPSEGRLVFGLSVDGFNPFTNQTAKQTVSSQGIWMTLLNLPPQLRFLQHNIHLVGVIPGPDKPSVDKINPYIQLVVNDLLEFWERGVFFSRTFKYPMGRLHRGMLVPLVCDMLAARQIIGYASSPNSHYICTMCDIDSDDVHVLDRDQWPKKNSAHAKRIATGWRDAASEADRNAISSHCGWRWSPLWDLPYMDPTRYTVVDSMHTLDLNLLKHHIRNLFVVNLDKPGGDGFFSAEPYNYTIRPTKEDVRGLGICAKLVTKNDSALLLQLLECHRRVLFLFSSQLGIVRAGSSTVIGNSWALANNIVNWVRGTTFDPHQSVTRPLSFQRRNGSSPQLDHFLEFGIAAPALDPTTELQDPPDGETVEPALQDMPPAPDDVDPKAIQRTLRRLADSSAAEDMGERSRAMNQCTAAQLAYICDVLLIDHSAIEMGKKKTKSGLITLLSSQLDEPSIEERLNQFESLPSPTGALLGRDVMEAAWADMKSAILPSWVTSAPRNWGTSQRGKLSADNWRVICTIHLPVTLIRLWSQGSEKKQEILENFMHLVSAVRLANLRTSSPQQIAAYNSHLHDYLTGIKHLFPHEKLRPSHHMAFHIGDGLHLFGPSHSHRANFFERYIRFFHSLNTNLHQGPLEATLSISSARTANLCSLLSDNEDIRRAVPSFIKVKNDIGLQDRRTVDLGTLLDPSTPSLTGASRPKIKTLSDAEFHTMAQLLRRQPDGLVQLSRTAQSVDEVLLKGLRYNTRESNLRNSTVIAQVSTSHETREAVLSIAAILEVFIGSDKRHYFVVGNEYAVLDEGGEADIYRRYGFAAGFLCHAQTSSVHIVALDSVASHCVVTPIDLAGQQFLHILPVDQAMFHFHSGVGSGD